MVGGGWDGAFVESGWVKEICAICHVLAAVGLKLIGRWDV